MKCCRRIVELSHSILYCAYHYHCLLPRSKHKLVKQNEKCHICVLNNLMILAPMMSILEKFHCSHCLHTHTHTHIHRLSTSGLSATKPPSLPHLKRQLSLTTPTMPRPPPSRHRSLTVIRSNTTSRRLKPSINNTTLIS